jgi:hypothetical protein
MTTPFLKKILSVKKNWLILLSFVIVLGLSPLGFAHAQTAMTLSALQTATQNYQNHPSVSTLNQLQSMQAMASQQAATAGNTTQFNAQPIEVAAEAAIKNTPAPTPNAFSMNPATSAQIQQQAAQTASVVANGGSCAPTTANGNDLTCASGLACDNNGICSAIPSNNSVSPNGWCGPNDSACQTGYNCNSSGICVANPAPTPATATAPASATFVPLTNLPIFCMNGVSGGNTCSPITSAPGLAAFFNALYKYCVGAAAVIAVIQIMRAGIMYMGGDSVSEVSQARQLISTAILGLVLVLSPVIVFSIIDPRILNLNIGSDFSCLGTSTSCPSLSTPAASTPSGTAGATGAGGTGTPSSASTGASTGATGAAAQSGAPTEAGTQQYQYPANQYILTIEAYGDTPTTSSCYTLLGGSYPDQASCQADMSKITATIQQTTGGNSTSNGLNVLNNCSLSATGAISVPTTNLCSSQPYMGGT